MSQFSGNPNSVYGATDPYGIGSNNQIGQLIGMMSAAMGQGGSSGRLPINLFSNAPNAFIPQEIENKRLSQTVIESMQQGVELQRLRSSNYNQGLIALNTTLEQRPLTDAEKTNLIRQGDAMGSVVANPLVQAAAGQFGFNVNAFDPFNGYATAGNAMGALRMSGASSYNINAGLVTEMTSGFGKRMYNAEGGMLEGNKAFGFSPFEQSQIVKSLQTRGAIAYDLNDIVGGLSDTERTAFRGGDASVVGKKLNAQLGTQLDKISPMLSEASALFGTKDVGEIFNNIDQVTGGLGNMNSSQARNQIGKLKEISETFGISVKAATDFIAQTSALAESRGLNGGVAAAGALNALGAGSIVSGFAANNFGASNSVSSMAALNYRADRIMSAQDSPMAGRIANTAELIDRLAKDEGVSADKLLEGKSQVLKDIYAAKNGDISAGAAAGIRDPGALIRTLASELGVNASDTARAFNNKAQTQANMRDYSGLAEGVANTNLSAKLMARNPGDMREIMKQYDLTEEGATILLSATYGADNKESLIKILQGESSTKDMDFEKLLTGRNFQDLKTKSRATGVLDATSAAFGLSKGAIKTAEMERKSNITAAQELHDTWGDTPIFNRITKALIDSNGDPSALFNISSVERIDALDTLLKGSGSIDKIAGDDKATRAAKLRIIGQTAGASGSKIQGVIDSIDKTSNSDEARTQILDYVSELKVTASESLEKSKVERKKAMEAKEAPETVPAISSGGGGFDVNELMNKLQNMLSNLSITINNNSSKAQINVGGQ